MTRYLEPRPASEFVEEIEESISAEHLRQLSPNLADLARLTTLETSYVDPAGRASIERFLHASRYSWRGAAAARVKGVLRANLASGSHPLGAIRLLSNRSLSSRAE